MTGPKKYATATAFRRALEDRLKLIAGRERLPLERLRRGVAFDRLLSRLFARDDAPWALKGGYALELSMKEARATRDIDLALRHTLDKGRGKALNDAILETLQAAASLDMGDFFVFEFGGVMQDLDAAPYGGARFPVATRMDRRIFVEFHLDVGAGDVVMDPLDMTQGRDWLGFAGVPASRFPTVSKEQHFAEKVHAYTIPRKTPNSRVRDMVDMLLLVGSGKLDRARISQALRATFQRRKTHPLPAALQPPPQAWKEPFAALAGQCGMPENLDEAFHVLDAFYSALP
jgi:hypothetical protein